MKGRPDDEVVAGHYIDSKDTILILNQKGIIKKFKPSDIVKGKKNHVGRQYITMTKKNPLSLVDCEIIHKNNTDLGVDGIYLEGSEGITQLDLSGKTPPKVSEIGTPSKIIIARNNSDFARN